jgi:hypothetical protein
MLTPLAKSSSKATVRNPARSTSKRTMRCLTVNWSCDPFDWPSPTTSASPTIASCGQVVQ